MSRGAFGSNFNVYCDLMTEGGGWIVIQRNKRDSATNFNRNWADYEKGFGDLSNEFWYGLEEIHYLTQSGQWEMRVDYQFSRNMTWSYLHYNQFSVGSANEEYPLAVGGFIGIGIDWFAVHLNATKFSTHDNDNDNDKYDNNCAASYQSGWWYNNKCWNLNINNARPVVHDSNAAGYGLLFTEMKIRPKDCIIQ